MKADGMRSLLVTGGAGFIGANFVLRALVQGGIRVTNLDKLTYAGNLENLQEVMEHPSHRFVHGDICDREAVSELLAAEKPDGLVHFAAESHVDRSIDGPADFIQTNILGTFTLLEAVREYLKEPPAEPAGRFRFVQVSTDEVYGSLGEAGFFHGETPYAPNSPYSASKAASDHLVRAYHHTYGLPVITTNCSNNYGRYQFPEKLIPLVILTALEGKPLPVYGDGGHIRDWLYIEDHCDALLEVLARGKTGETYNIGGHNERTNLEVVRGICELLARFRPDSPFVPFDSLITFVKDRPGHDRRDAIDAGKIGRELGWKPRETFESGLEKKVRWYLEHTEWHERIASGAYRRERLGLSS